MRDGKKIVTTSICFDRDVFKMIEQVAEKDGYGSRSRVVNHAVRRLFGMKPKENPYKRERIKT